MKKKRICIVEDVQLFRSGLVNIINQQPDMVVVGEAEDGLSALRIVRDTKPDLILMDIQMPISDGIESTALIREILPDSTILMLTALEDEDKLLEAIKAGASGYLLKSTNSQGFIRSIRAALDGEAVLPRKLSLRLVEEFAELTRSLGAESNFLELPTLTFREVEVLRCVAEGKTNQEAAEELNVSIHTVKSHIRNISEKLGANNRWEAVAIARDRKILLD